MTNLKESLPKATGAWQMWKTSYGMKKMIKVQHMIQLPGRRSNKYAQIRHMCNVQAPMQC